MQKLTERVVVFGIVSYNGIRHFILDRKLKEDEIIQINIRAFDNLVLEFREFYSESMPRGLKILGVKVEESFDLDMTMVRILSPAREEATEIEYPRIARNKWSDYFRSKLK